MRSLAVFVVAGSRSGESLTVGFRFLAFFDHNQLYNV